MSISYVGSSTFLQCSPAVWSAKKTYEPDECTVAYNGSALLKEAFINAQTRGQTLAYIDHNGTTHTRPKMFLQSISDEGHPRIPKVILNYIGFRDGERPDVKKESGLVTSSVSTTRESGGQNMTLTYRYNAARTTYNWYTDEEPDPEDPEFNTVENMLDPLDSSRFLGRSISGASGQYVTLADFTALFNTLVRDVQLSGPEVKPIIPGLLWQCSISADYVLIGS